MRTLTLVTQKGGTGKTTLATSLAVAATEAGESVVLLDLDPQGSLMAWGSFRGEERPAPVVERFPANRIAELPAMIAGLKNFSLVILDTPGADNTATHKAMDAATMCLVPLRPTRLDAHAVRATVQAVLKGKTPFAFILNQCPTIPNSPRANEMAAGLATMGILALPKVCQRSDYQDAFAAGLGVTEYAPAGRAAEEMRQLWQWVNRETKGMEAAA